jgi:hypothetical protein
MTLIYILSQENYRSHTITKRYFSDIRSNYSVSYHLPSKLSKLGVRCLAGGKIAEQANALVNPLDKGCKPLRYLLNGGENQLNSVLLRKVSQASTFSTVNNGELNSNLDPVTKSNFYLPDKAE